MGDSSKIPTEEDIDKSSEFRSQAAGAYSEQKFQEAIDLYTNAIEINPGNALFHAKRGQAFLKLEKPNACIRDCNKALEINCDSAAAYKFRGRAHRLLGNWEEAAKDLRQACKLDYDEEADEWLREVTPNAKMIEQHSLKQQRKKAEHQRKAEEKRREKARSEAQNNSGASAKFPTGSPGRFPSGFANPMSGVNLEEVMSCFNDPEIKAALLDILMNKASIDKYKNNPKIVKHIEHLRKIGIFPGSEESADAGVDTDPVPPQADDKPKEAPKKPDFVDDGLD